MAPKKSIFRQPGARHFQLVHRSQRDPLIHDPEASQHVLKPFERENVKKGKSRADLEITLSPSDLAHDPSRANIGEASLYGIYYDDTDYDYMRHLKQVGVQEEGVDSILIEAPQPSNKSKGRGRDRAPIELRDLPEESLPSSSELPRTYEAEQAVPASIAGFQPDMDPHLRQTLEALEDDAFVDEGVEEDFFTELVADGERDEDEAFEYEFHEHGEEELPEVEGEGEEGQGWEARFKQFEAAQKEADISTDAASISEYDEEDRDTVTGLPRISVIGGKHRRKKTSDASGYSMSSSSMYRNEALTVLDERFDAIEHEYEDMFSDEEDEKDHDLSDSDEAPDLIASREDFESMLDEFLTDYEILGGKMKHRLAGDSAAEKLDTIRRAMGQDERVRVQGQGDDDVDEEPKEFAWLEEEKEDRWDCETILTTYSNLENHPRMISARASKPIVKIHLDPRTGLPSIQEKLEPKSKSRNAKPPRDEDKDEDDSDLTETERTSPVRVTVARSRDESKEDKKARKAAVKAERRTRRAEKKNTKEEFAGEYKRQVSDIVQKGNARVRKL